METFVPLADRVLLRRRESEETYRGIIHLPDQTKSKAQVAEVIAIGPGKRDSDGSWLEAPVQLGDLVMFGRYSGTDIRLDEQELTIIRWEDILGIIKDPTTKADAM